MKSTINQSVSGSIKSAKWLAGTALAIVAWGVFYSQLQPFADWLVSLLVIDTHSLFGDAITFFLFETPKVILLLTLIVFFMGGSSEFRLC